MMCHSFKNHQHNLSTLILLHRKHKATRNMVLAFCVSPEPPAIFCVIYLFITSDFMRKILIDIITQNMRQENINYFKQNRICNYYIKFWCYHNNITSVMKSCAPLIEIFFLFDVKKCLWFNFILYKLAVT